MIARAFAAVLAAAAPSMMMAAPTGAAPPAAEQPADEPAVEDHPAEDVVLVHPDEYGFCDLIDTNERQAPECFEQQYPFDPAVHTWPCSIVGPGESCDPSGLVDPTKELYPVPCQVDPRWECPPGVEPAKVATSTAAEISTSPTPPAAAPAVAAEQPTTPSAEPLTAVSSASWFMPLAAPFRIDSRDHAPLAAGESRLWRFTAGATDVIPASSTTVWVTVTSIKSRTGCTGPGHIRLGRTIADLDTAVSVAHFECDPGSSDFVSQTGAVPVPIWWRNNVPEIAYRAVGSSVDVELFVVAVSGDV